ncbi:hypothetical protein [Crassaminicella indica]|uniref:Replication restart DNA helicase PriA n=1 Tax=Crassaminicella indica TaxID=2855394 RepID=A0ABX8RE21_9CLOT|nr:hypothetical protein [Crassaminicella indica]QXM05980.1 hypothetical protein KVH43_11560 [Crassaminicella indica]
MHIVCKTCGNIIKDPSSTRCPRCYTLLKKQHKCEDCKGCTLNFKKCDK